MALALGSLDIERFRGLSSLRLEDLGQVNVFFGQNNTGKTSVLEAASVICRPFDLANWLAISTSRELRQPGDTHVEDLAQLFPSPPRLSPGRLVAATAGLLGSVAGAVTRVTAEYNVVLRFDDFHPAPSPLHATYRAATLRVALDGERGAQEVFEIAEGQEGSVPVVHPELSLPVEYVTPVSHRVDREYVRRLSEDVLSNARSSVLTLMRELDEDIQGLEVLAPNGRAGVYVESWTSGFLPLKSLGDGVRHALVLALAVHRARGGVLLIDEIGASLHFTALPRLFSWLRDAARRSDVQIFATTHSLEAVDALLGDDSEGQGVVGYQLARRDGAVRAKRIPGELLHSVRYERGLEVR